MCTPLIGFAQHIYPSNVLKFGIVLYCLSVLFDVKWANLLFYIDIRFPFWNRDDPRIANLSFRLGVR